MSETCLLLAPSLSVCLSTCRLRIDESSIHFGELLLTLWLPALTWLDLSAAAHPPGWCCVRVSQVYSVLRSLWRPAQAAAATTAAVSEAAAAPVDPLPSPFVASALLPLSPVHHSPAGAHAVMPIPPAAAGLRVSTGCGATTRAAAAPPPPAAAAAAAGVPGPAAVAAGGALWQLPGGSSSALFGSRVSSSGVAVHPLAALNPMPAATAAAVGALFGNKVDGLHHAFSAPEGDMYSLPRLGFGLATLPSPQQMFPARGSSSVRQRQPAEDSHDRQGRVADRPAVR